MKIGIVGGNSEVAIEMSAYLRDLGHEIIPIVRNKLAAAYLAYSNYDYRIADISHESDCRETLPDIEVVVIAAHARPFSRGYNSFKNARETNKCIIKNTVEYSDRNATIIYLSSIAAYGKEYSVDGNYTKEKRSSEKFLTKYCKKYGKNWYALRLGHVFGNNTNYVKEIKQNRADVEPLVVDTLPSTSSNTVHPQLISEVINICCNKNINSGEYAVINNPQWTWRDVFEFIFPNKKVTFTGNDNESKYDGYIENIKSSILSLGWNLFGTDRSKFSNLYHILPGQIDKISKKQMVLYKYRSNLNELRSNHPEPYKLAIMDQPPILDNTFPEVPEIHPKKVKNKERMSWNNT